MTGSFTEYQRPNGKRVQRPIDLEGCDNEYLEMLGAGYNLAAEVLMTGTASLTIEGPNCDADITLIPGGQITSEQMVGKVQEVFQDMLKARKWENYNEDGEWVG